MPGIIHFRDMIFGMLREVDEPGKGLMQDHRASVRASSLPICWRDYALTTWAKKGRGSVPREEWGLGNLLFVEIGTAVHRVAQAYLGRGKVLYGSWECVVCGKTWVNQVSPGNCCGKMPDYIEYTAVHPNKRIGYNGEFGHIDGILPLPHNLGYIVVEFKTTGIELAKGIRKNGPYEKHQRQASAYFEFCEAGLLKVIKRSNPKPKYPRGKVIWTRDAKMPPGGPVGILYVYIIRDKPRMHHWIPLLRPPVRGELERLERDSVKAQRNVDRGKLPRGVCKIRSDARDEWGSWCPWVAVCFADNPDVVRETAEKLYLEYARRQELKERKDALK